jgi:hypothetical protein
MHYNDSVTIRNTATATANGTTQRQNLCAATDIVTTTCSVLTSCSKDASTTMQRHQTRTESNRIPPAKQPSKHRHVCVNRNQSQIRIKFDPASRPATVASLSRCQPGPMCSSSFRLAFQRCRVPVVAFVQQRDHADAGAGAERTTITCYQSVNSAITTKLCC